MNENYKPDFDFVVIDFETANYNEHACSLGLAEIIDGQIQTPKFWFIKPLCYPNFNPSNIRVNKITPEMVADAKTFSQLWGDELNGLLTGKILVAHNAKQFDIRLLVQSLIDCNITPPPISYMCTMEIAKACYPFNETYTLPALCQQLNIPLIQHHNALDDVVATAKLALKLLENSRVSKNVLVKKGFISTFNHSYYSPIYPSKPYNISSEYTELQQAITQLMCTDDNICTPGYMKDKEFCITGQFYAYDRDDVAAKLESLGGIQRKSITKKINIVFIGDGACPVKMQKIIEHQKNNHDIVIFNEHHIRKILRNIEV